jgi:hypothetical protein
MAGRLGLEPSKVDFGDRPPRLRSTQIGGERTIGKPCPFGHPAVSGRVRSGRLTLQNWRTGQESNLLTANRDLRLATWCFANQPTVQPCGGSGWNRTIADWLKARCTAFVLRTRNWFPISDLHGSSSRYECDASLSKLIGNGAEPRTCTSRLSLTRRAHRYLCLQGEVGASRRICAFPSSLPRTPHAILC